MMRPRLRTHRHLPRPRGLPELSNPQRYPPNDPPSPMEVMSKGPPPHRLRPPARPLCHAPSGAGGGEIGVRMGKGLSWEPPSGGGPSGLGWRAYARSPRECEARKNTTTQPEGLQEATKVERPRQETREEKTLASTLDEEMWPTKSPKRAPRGLLHNMRATLAEGLGSFGGRTNSSR